MLKNKYGWRGGINLNVWWFGGGESLAGSSQVVGTHLTHTGADPGGGGSWGSGPPFWGTPKLHKEGKNVPRMCTKTPRFST